MFLYRGCRYDIILTKLEKRNEYNTQIEYIFTNIERYCRLSPSYSSSKQTTNQRNREQKESNDEEDIFFNKEDIEGNYYIESEFFYRIKNEKLS